MGKKREPTPDQIRRDERDAVIRRVLGLVELYDELAASLRACEAWDAELALRMIATRETVLRLLEAAMPVPVAPASPPEIEAVQ